MWKETIPSMQTFKCSSISTNQTITLRDNRDNNTYEIKRFSDGKCWMMEDLRISGITLTPENSNINKVFRLPKSGEGDGFGECQYKPIVYLASVGQKQSGMYSWLAAIGDDSPNSYIGSLSARQTSICPKGWSLPDTTYGRSMENNINRTIGSVAYYGDHSSAPSFPSSAASQCYWSSTGTTEHGSYGCNPIKGIDADVYGTCCTPSIGSACYVRCITE